MLKFTFYKKSYVILIALFLFFHNSNQIFAQISGTVFRDFNANGVKNNTATYNETGVSGITVKAYNSTGAEVGSTTTSTSGTYSFTGLSLPLRIEFTGYMTEDYTGPAGTGNASSVQFYTAASTTADFGINYPQQYTSSANPNYVVAQFEANRPPASDPLATAMLIQSYNTRGNGNDAPSIAKTSDIGGTWGVAYDRKNSLIYASAFVKRYSSMKDNDADGKEDIGAIYSMTQSGSPVLWKDLSTLGIDFGLSLMPTISQRALPLTLVGPTHDALMYPLVGKIGIGDIEISDDYSKLFVTNLYDQKVYTIDIATKTVVGSGISVPSPCSGGAGNGRPFGLKYHRGKLYVGAVCDAVNTNSIADLSASVYRLDGASFTSVLNFPLNYVKGYAFKDLDDNNSNGIQEEWGKSWNAWSDVQPTPTFHSNVTSPASEVLIYPQPMLVNMEFDIDESMVLVFNDRFGHQNGNVNYGTNTADNSTFYTGLVGGDILRASFNAGTYTIENNATVNSVTTAGAGNTQGPGGGEFYLGDHDGANYHAEDIIAGSTFFAGRGQVAALVTDPIDYFVGGIYFFNNTTGNVVLSGNQDVYELYNAPWNNAKFGKANGLGDMELISDAAPIEIGNRVWHDTNNNGIQDAGELGIAGVNIDLYQGTTLVATIPTDVNGNYYFNATNVTGGILPNTAYEIRVSTTQSPISTYYLSAANTDGTTNGDERDSDGLGSSTAVITLTTGSYGANNHSYDFGFRDTPPCTKPDAGADMTSTGGSCINLTAITPTTGTWSAMTGNSTGATLGTTTSGVANVCFTNASNGTYSFIYADGACEDTINVVVTPKPACLGNYVWNDVNQDGVQNNGEVGVSGVTTTLYNATNNTILATVKTDAYGFYQFCGLTPGDYKVGFSLPTNYTFTGSNSGADDAVDSDPSAITGLTATVTLAAGDSNMTVDAGIYQPQPTTASVGDKVWYDANSNGTQDNGENGVSGVTISLYNCANPTVAVATTVSDANGNYLFENVAPGSYSVRFTAPTGTTFTSNAGLLSVTDNSDVDATTGKTSCFPVIAGDKITYVDAGIIPQTTGMASLGDKVWNDANQNGMQDPTETGVSGVTVTLYDATGTTVISTTTTDGLGNYGFNNLTPACYVVGFSSIPSGYILTTQNAGTDSTKNSDANATTGMTSQVCLTAGQNNPTIDAGIYNAANTNSVGDLVWYDANHNGLQDGSEYGYSGAVVTLYDCATNAIVATTTTNANGNYLFDGLANGDYYVGFGFIGGYQFTSQNADVAGIAGGSNSDANPSNGLTSCVTLSGNTHITTVDAGIYPGSNRTASSSLGDIVWTDANNNGLQDNGETGVPGVTATLYNCNDINTPIATTITDGLGNYIFTNLTGGNYVVGFSNIPAGYTFTTQGTNIEDANNSDANTTTGKTACIALGLGEDKMTVDAGIVAPTGTVCLGDYVWIDLNNDGTQQTTEPAVPGVTVKLYDNNTNTVLQVATTNADGKYMFCGLTNGSTYSVGFENLPAGFTFTTSTGILATTDNSDANPTTGRTTTVTLGATNDLTLDAGIVSTTTAVVGNYVWYDENSNGIQDATEAPISGVLVTMYDNTNTAVASAVTDATGHYLFTNVTPGTYTIGFAGYPATLVPTTKGTTNPATADDDSNIDPITGKTDAFTVTAGSSNLTLDAGYKANPIAGLGNYVWYDVNQNGLQDVGEPALAGVVVTLYDATGTTPIATAITDGNGAYSFPNLTAGDYVVGFSNIPTGFTRTQNVGTQNDALNSDVLVTGKTTTITLAAGTYNPNIDAGYYMGFALSVKELQATTAILSNDNTSCNVNWFTKDEINTKDFTIERSIDNSNFEAVGTTEAKNTTIGQTNYTFTDNVENVKVTTIYYRIKLNDIDGKQTISNVITARKANATEEVSVYPIPFDNQVTIAYPTTVTTTVDIVLTDVSGRIIRKETQELVEGMNTIVLSNLTNLSSGTYYIKMTDNNTGNVFVRKLNK